MEENQELEGASVEGEDTLSEESTDEQVESENTVPLKPKNPNAKWYILQAYTGYETRVEQTIREKLRIQDLEHLIEESP